MNGLYKTLI